MVIARANRAGPSCCSTSSNEGWLRHRCWPWEMAPWDSGRRCERSSAKCANSAAGSTRRPTCSTSYPRVCNRKRRLTSTKSGRPRRCAAANRAFDHFLEKYQAKYHAACECLSKDRDVLLTIYDFPAEHWKHLRTTNPIESTFSTIRLRHRRTKGSGTRRTSLAMMFKLAQSAETRWRRLNGHQQILHLLQGKTFIDGLLQDAD